MAPATVNSIDWYANLPIWGDRGGPRHWRAFREMHRQASAEKDWLFKLSLADMAVKYNISSHAGLDRTIKFLLKHGLIEVVDPGTPDQHLDGQRIKGRAATYRIRHRGASSSFSTSSGAAHPPTLSPKKMREGRGGSPLPNPPKVAPNYDLTLDIWVKEPHLLRLLDLVFFDGRESIDGLTPTTLAAKLGISVSGAWEMLKRWTERMWVRNGRLDVGWLFDFEVRESWTRTAMKVKKACSIRTAALEGRWKPKRFRLAQRLKMKGDGRWRSIDFEWAEMVRRMQWAKGESGQVPWIEDGDLDIDEELRMMAAEAPGATLSVYEFAGVV
jgi:hypothetical protein